MKRLGILKILIMVFYIVVIGRIFYVGVIKHSYYNVLYQGLVDNYIYTRSAPRGRILDCNGKILVDNKGIREVVYQKLMNVSFLEEISIAEELSKVLNFSDINLSQEELKSFYFLKYSDQVLSLLPDDIKEKYNNRLLSKDKYIDYVYEVISDDMLSKLNQEVVYIYNKMNEGYYNDLKIIKSDITALEYTSVNELNLRGIRCDMYYERVYNYDTFLNQLFGDIGPIPKENKDFYIDKGYSLTDIVGTSFLEEYYEEYLKGFKGVYKISSDNTLIKEKDVIKGNDLVLAIDIDIQLEIEELLVSEIKKAKKVFASKYYNGSYIVVSNPFDGSIIAMAGIKYNSGSFTSDVVGLITNSYTVGSVVKGASHSVAYLNGVLDENTKMTDRCVKLYSQKEKCSWKRLGTLNDINALVQSSNYFQFVNAIRVSGEQYRYNMRFNPSLNDFNRYRDIFASYGLGSLTGIDISGESIGIRGDIVSGDLLLNLSIGQYDTYTPVQLNQYISSIANGTNRYKLRIAEAIIDNDGKRIEINPKKVLNNNLLEEKYMNRIKKGLEGVVSRGTGYSYIRVTKGAGKTGTSETYFNGKSTITQSFVGYFPSDNPMYAYSIISPHIGYENNVSNYQYPINSRLSRQISNILFEN